MDRARAVVVGGGITGASVAYHLAKVGWRETVLLEKDELTSGSTCHAAGLVTQFNPSPTMMRFRRYSIELYRELGVFEQVGGLRFASSEEQLKELQRGVSRARGIGLEVDLISGDESARLMPAITKRSLHGAIWVPSDGHLDPHTATHALAAAARSLGARILTQRRVTGFKRGSRGEVTAVETDGGRIETDVVVIAGGIWAAQIAAMAGAFIVSTPVDHQHAALLAVPGHELPHDMPCFRDPDNLIYGKSEAGGVVLGGYEADPVARWIDGVPWDHAGTSLPPDQARFEPLLAGAARRFPFMGEAGIVKLVCHPDAMTPDANPLVGPVPGVRGLYMAAGLSLNGFGGAGGIGRSVAELVTAGEAELDLYPYRPWRFGPVHRDHRYVAELAREAYRYYYYLRYPYDSDEWGRPRRTSALHERLQDGGAVFGAKHGWERAEYFEPGRPWRRAGADQRKFGWTKPPYFAVLAEEHRAFRESVGLIDMTSFGKIDLRGPGALPLLERVAGNRIDRPAGTVVYTQLLERNGGIAADVTVTRLAQEHFRVVTGAGYVNSDLGWLRLQLRDGDPQVDIRETTDELSVIGMWGPHARDVLERVADGDVSEAEFPFMHARHILIGGASALAQRVTYVGELGWELYMEPGWAVQVWDRLVSAGRTFGIRPGGYRVLDSLRMEKGYRYYGTDLTLLDNPFEAGLGFCVQLDKEDFNGREALVAARESGLKRRLRTLAVGGEDYIPIYGGEAVHSEGGVVGRLRSCAYGFTARKNLAYSYLPVGDVPGEGVQVEVFGHLIPATVMTDAVVPKRAAEQPAR
ncbi:MAG TPA: FAD-dependent oxidoreductase [Candidatus Dormibacteraeota bacterium]|nr:FAD-dependent oxidoreductase [Candidatus Dormibacteraeota bacterium]